MKTILKTHTCALALSIATRIAYAQTPAPQTFIESNSINALYGCAVASAGDLNNDGYDDLLVGAMDYDGDQSDEGKVFVYLGSASGISTVANFTLEASNTFAEFGRSVSAAGDVNNDGYDDIIIGSPSATNGQSDEGRVFIYHGNASGVNTVASIILESNQASAIFGISVDGAGDVNGDGYDDVIIGASKYDNGQTDEGRVYIYHGSASGISASPAITLEADQATSYFGQAVSSAGDINGDGYDDIIVGAYYYDNGLTNEGAAFIYHGSASGISASPVLMLENNMASSYFGSGVAGAGDVNNDGYADVMIGAMEYTSGHTDEGIVYIYHGTAAGLYPTVAGSTESDRTTGLCGKSMSFGDYDGDGYDDIIVGAEGFGYALSDDDIEGRAWICNGSPVGILGPVIASMESNKDESLFGSAVAFAGDLNGDGFDDVVVGASEYENGQTNEGAAYVYYGSNCAPTKYYYDEDNDGFGVTHIYTTGCTAPEGYVALFGDCDAGDSTLNPATLWYLDADQDGYYSGVATPVAQCTSPGPTYNNLINGGGDCNDNDPSVYPDPIAEKPDSIDNDCDGLTDEDLLFSYAGHLEGDELYARMGYAVASAGDINGDGYDDMLASAPYHDGENAEGGKTFVHYGSPTGISLTPDVIIYGPVHTWVGYSVASAGDVNGDGYDDIVAGALIYENGQSEEGAAYIYHGSAAGLITTPATIVESNQSYCLFGHIVSSAGDVNGDGYDDIVVGAYEYDNGQSEEGAAFVYHGSASGINPTPAIMLECNKANAQYGISVSTAGDVNNDGYGDIVVGAPYFANGQSGEGAVFIYHGSATGIHPTANLRIETNVVSTYLGRAVCGAGDVNGDGYDDIAASSYQGDGIVYIYHGSSTGIVNVPVLSITEDGSLPINDFGNDVSPAGDVNGDGYDDIVVANNMHSNIQTYEGKVYVFEGSPTGVLSTPYFTIEGDRFDQKFGYCASGAGDLNGDGYDDLIVGSPDMENDLTSEGKVFIYYSNLCTPGAEICNGIDDNCNGLVDDGISETISIGAGGATTFCQGGSVLLTATYSGTSVQWKKNGVNIAGATTSTYSVTKTGTYTCETTGPCDTELSNSIGVTVNKNPTASISAAGSTTFCAGGSVTLNVVPVAGSNYQWYKGASAVAGATNTSYMATTAGNYKCRVTKTATGCFKNSNSISVTVPCRDGEMINHSFTVYPNPNNGSFTISAQFATAATISIEVYNAIGEMVHAEQIAGGEINQPVDLGSVAAGIYIVRLNDGTTFTEQKIIVE